MSLVSFTDQFHSFVDTYTHLSSRIVFYQSQRLRFAGCETAHSVLWAMQQRAKIRMLAKVKTILELRCV